MYLLSVGVVCSDIVIGCHLVSLSISEFLSVPGLFRKKITVASPFFSVLIR